LHTPDNVLQLGPRAAYRVPRRGFKVKKKSTGPVSLFPVSKSLDKPGRLQYYKTMTEKAKKENKTAYRNPKRTFEKSGSVNPETSYFVSLENVVNTDNQDI